jgi:hypothetical protein
LLKNVANIAGKVAPKRRNKWSANNHVTFVFCYSVICVTIKWLFSMDWYLSYLVDLSMNLFYNIHPVVQIFSKEILKMFGNKINLLSTMKPNKLFWLINFVKKKWIVKCRNKLKHRLNNRRKSSMMTFYLLELAPVVVDVSRAVIILSVAVARICKRLSKS